MNVILYHTIMYNIIREFFPRLGFCALLLLCCVYPASAAVKLREIEQYELISWEQIPTATLVIPAVRKLLSYHIYPRGTSHRDIKDVPIDVPIMISQFFLNKGPGTGI